MVGTAGPRQRPSRRGRGPVRGRRRPPHGRSARRRPAPGAQGAVVPRELAAPAHTGDGCAHAQRHRPDSGEAHPGEAVVMEQIRLATAAGTFDALAAGPPGGREVLLLHGFPQGGAEFEHQLRALGDAGYRAVAPDQRGYSAGVRPTAVAEYGVAELIGDALRIADALQWKRFDL